MRTRIIEQYLDIIKSYWLVQNLKINDIEIIVTESENQKDSTKIKQEKTRSMDQSNKKSNSKKNEIQSSIDEPIMNISEQYDERVQNPLHKYKY